MSSTPGPPPTSTLTAALAQLPAKFRHALALYQQGNPALARAVCEEILAVKPDQFDTLNMLAMIAGQANDFERAVKWFDRAIEVDPAHAATHCNRGFALQEAHMWDAALASYDRAIALKSDYALAHNNRGNVLRRLGRLEEALASYDRALGINSAAVQSPLLQVTRRNVPTLETPYTTKSFHVAFAPGAIVIRKLLQPETIELPAVQMPSQDLLRSSMDTCKSPFST